MELSVTVLKPFKILKHFYCSCYLLFWFVFSHSADFSLYLDDFSFCLLFLTYLTFSVIFISTSALKFLDPFTFFLPSAFSFPFQLDSLYFLISYFCVFQLPFEVFVFTGVLRNNSADFVFHINCQNSASPVNSSASFS